MKSREWYEQQYNTSYSVQNEDEVLTNWILRANATRRLHSFQPDIHYGPHPREVLDFYPALNSKGVLIFIHGGYWRGLSKFETSWVAENFVNHGLSVALINYPLCPEVSLAELRESATRAFVHLYKFVLNSTERKNIVVSGHSAGGYLAAFHLAKDWTLYGLPQNPIVSVIAMSGIYDVAPLMRTSMNVDIRITAETAPALNLLNAEILSLAPLTLVVGGEEPSEFHRQANELAVPWKILKPKIITLQGANHFSVVDSLADAKGDIYSIVHPAF